MHGTTRSSYSRRRYPYDGNNVEDDHSDSSSSTDFLADPFKAFRPSLFGALKSPPDDGDGSEEISGGGANETLPSLHDKSWIGARMSPIHSNDDDDDDNTASKNNNNNNTIGADFDPYATNFPSRQPSGFISLSQQHVPSAGHARTEYPPFGIHPLQPTKWPLSPPGRPSNAAIPWPSRCQNVGTFVCGLSGLSLLGMGIYDLYYYYFSTTTSSTQNQHPPLWDTKWTLPYGQPSCEAKIILGGFVPNPILFQSQYWRLITSALQCNSILEWLCLLLAWFVCQRQSIHPISWITILTVHTLSTMTGQLWMLAIWLLGCDFYQDNSQQGTLVTHCAAWGTCGVLCFVGMARPNRRFGCFMICIVLVVLSLLQHLTQINSLPVVVGCTASSFVGWTLFGSQLIPLHNTTTLRLAQKPDHFSIPISTGPPQSKIHSTVRLCCGAMVMILWVLPLLILAYLDYWEGYLNTKTS